KSQAMRDRAYAQSAADGKPLPALVDSISGEVFQNVAAIPEFDKRREAGECLLQAAYILKTPEILKDALRLQLLRAVSTPSEWDNLYKVAEALAKADPKYAQAHFLLAKADFEQPTRTGPTPWERRLRSRVLAAQKHMAGVDQDPSFPIWRTLHLKAQIEQWLTEDYARAGKRTEEQAARKVWHALVLDDKSGALARARQREGFDRLGAWDIEGIWGLQGMAIDLLVYEGRKEPEGGRAKLLKGLNEVLEFCQKAPQTPQLSAGKATEVAVRAAFRAQPALATADAQDWSEVLNTLHGLMQKTAK